ncbi:MAG: hypothetical protein RIQ81_886 [Pseudomonadota bacterium]
MRPGTQILVLLLNLCVFALAGCLKRTSPSSGGLKSTTETISQKCQADPFECSAFQMMVRSGYMTNCAKLWQDTGAEVYAFDEFDNVHHKVQPVMKDTKTRLTTIGQYVDDARTALMSAENVDQMMTNMARSNSVKLNWRDIPVGRRPTIMGGSTPVPVKFYALRVDNKLLNKKEWVIFRTFVPPEVKRSFRYSSDILDLATEEFSRQCYPARPHSADDSAASISEVIRTLNDADRYRRQAENLDALYKGMVTFVEAAPGTGEVAKIYRGCYLKESSCLRAAIVVTANVATYVVLAPATTSAALGAKGYLMVTTIGAAANAAEGGIQTTEAIQQGRNGHWGLAALHGAGAILRFTAATGMVLEATKAVTEMVPSKVGGQMPAQQATTPAVTDTTIQDFYQAAASSPVFKKKLSLANLLSGGKKVTVDEILLELQQNAKFTRIDSLAGARVDITDAGTFVFQHSADTGIFSRATAHHELLHLAQFLRNPALKVEANQLSFIARQAYEPIPALIGSPEIFGAPTLIVAGEAVYLAYQSAGLIFKALDR